MTVLDEAMRIMMEYRPPYSLRSPDSDLRQLAANLFSATQHQATFLFLMRSTMLCRVPMHRLLKPFSPISATQKPAPLPMTLPLHFAGSSRSPLHFSTLSSSDGRTVKP